MLFVLLASCGGEGPASVDGGPDATIGDAAVAPDGPAAPPEADGAVAEVNATLALSLTVHLEGHNTSGREMFDRYVANIDERATLFERYGAVLTLETKELTEGSERHGENPLAMWAERGHAVGVHADIGGRDDPSLTTASMSAMLQSLRERNQALGLNIEHVSGVCAAVDWVEAVRAAGFIAVTGAVDWCLKSLPLSEQPSHVQACTNAAECHDPYPSELAEQLVLRRMASGATWTSHHPEGPVILVPSTGTLSCRAEARSGEESPTHCAFDMADVDAVLADIEEAVGLAQPGRINSFLMVWSFGQAYSVRVLESMLQRMGEVVERGDARWVTVPSLVQEYVDAGGAG